MVPSELIMMVIIGAASGMIGAFALMRKMALASDAISHVALPGLGLALLLQASPLIGGAAALLLGTLLIWFIEKRASLATDIVIGVVFSASLAFGTLLTPEEDILHALFGEFTALLFSEIVIGTLAASLIIGMILLMKERLALTLISPDLARTSGINLDLINLVFLLIFAVNVILGLRFLGVLLMGSLIIIPAAISKNISWNLKSDLGLSAILAVLCIIVGYYLSQKFGLATGPTIISVAAALFFMSLILKQKR